MKTKIGVRWTVVLPGSGVDILVKKGDRVKKADTLVRYTSENTVRLDVGRLATKLTGIVGREFKTGDVIWNNGLLGGGKLVSPIDGHCTGIDEFGNLLMTNRGQDEVSILSPVEATVVDIDASGIVLEFEAKEFKGDGMARGWVWGCGTYNVIKDLSGVDWQSADKVIFCSNMSLAMVSKADVVGVKGMVAVNKIGDDLGGMEADFPIIVLNSEEIDDLARAMGKVEHDILIDVTEGRLLVV